MQSVSNHNEDIEGGFAEDTVVLVEGGKLSHINHIEMGKSVVSRCDRTGKLSYKKVIRLLKRFEVQTVAIYCTGSPEYLSRFRVGLPPFYAATGQQFRVIDKGWVAVRDLQVGDELVTCDKGKVIVNVIEVDLVDTVYTLEVEEFHSYFVNLAGVWVHNNAHSAQSESAGRALHI